MLKYYNAKNAKLWLNKQQDTFVESKNGVKCRRQTTQG